MFVMEIDFPSRTTQIYARAHGVRQRIWRVRNSHTQIPIFVIPTQQ